MKEAAFETLFKRYYNEALLYVCSLCHNRSLAEEIVQEAFFRALTSIDEETDRFKFWLFKVCRNCFFDHTRKSKRLTTINDSMSDDEDQLVDNVIKGEEYRALYRAISYLGDSYREAVRLYYFDSLSVKEVAAVMNISVDNVKITLYRARNKLKQFMEEYYGAK